MSFRADSRVLLIPLQVDALQTDVAPLYKQQQWSPWTVDSKSAGQYKTAGKFTYLRVFKAGHEVPAYGGNGLEVGQAALVFFEQIMSRGALRST